MKHITLLILLFAIVNTSPLHSVERLNKKDIYDNYKDVDLKKYIIEREMFAIRDKDVKDTLFIIYVAYLDTTQLTNIRRGRVSIIRRKPNAESYRKESLGFFLFTDDKVDYSTKKYYSTYLKTKSQIDFWLKNIDIEQLYRDGNLFHDYKTNLDYLCIDYCLVPEKKVSKKIVIKMTK